MSPRPQLVVREPNAVTESHVDAQDMTLAEFRQALRSGAYFGMLGRYRSAELDVYSLAAFGKLWPYALLLPPLARGETVVRDSEGGRLRVGIRLTMRLMMEAVRDRASAASLTARLNRSLNRIAASNHARTYDASKPVLYLRTDFWFGIASGGSVGHIAGVVNNLGTYAGAPVLVTTDPIPTVADTVEVHVVRPGSPYRNLVELRMAAFNETLGPQVEALLDGRQPGFIYQRYSPFSFSGLALAVRYSVPLVLEYNGSEVWMARHWGQPFKHERLAERIEMANMLGADLIVVVSRPMRDELVSRGVDSDKILVNPNGVNLDLYSPDVDGTPVRKKYGLEGKVVVGFIGTFGLWHGAEVLAEAFGCLLERTPEYRERVRLLMMGDGVTMEEVVGNLEAHGARDLAVLPGLVPQAEGPAYLAACDILASPHVPNPDGTPFFGSPTKLFEYMAMGKAIVASDLDQIGEVLEDERTAVMVPPQDVDALVEGLERLIRDSELRERLGAAAREQAVTHHSWSEHTQRIVEALRARCGDAS